MSECSRQGEPTATAAQPDQRMKRASPDARWWPAHYTGGDVEVSRSSVQRAEQFPPLNPTHCSLCPPQTRDFALHSVGASRKSRCVVPFFFYFFRVAGVPVRRRPNTGQVMPLRCTVAPASIHISAANRAGNGPMLN